MAVFISHSFENKPEFDNIVDALVLANVPYWNPANVKPGSSLREQLRRAVEHCSLCIFVATHRSLQSSWCGAELGAFWGAGKPIIAYIADSSLRDEDLPPILQGDVWERRIARVTARAKELLTELGASSDGDSKIGAAHVGNMTVDQLEKLIVGAVSLAAAQGKTENTDATPEAIGQAAKGVVGHVLEGIRTAERVATQSGADWRRRILWVDDRPNNNSNERRALEEMGLSLRSLSPPKKLWRSSLRNASPLSSRTWDGGRARKKATYSLMRLGATTQKHPSSFTPARMHRNTSEKQGNEGRKEVRTAHGSSLT